ncbi:MAG: hypothetical protein CME65_00255 [Halobacteriovoraceae bacterium]|nr:hypothetical protein [Halobacteriovoraceae bacterium]
MFRKKNNWFLPFMILSWIFCVNAGAQEISQEKILNRLTDLKTSSIEEYSSQMEEVGELMAEYIRTKEQECSGDFSSVEFDDGGTKKRVRKKLSKKEKSLCLYMLIDFRIKVTKLSFEIRKNHLKAIQNLQLGELDELEKQQVQELEKLAQKFR